MDRVGLDEIKARIADDLEERRALYRRFAFSQRSARIDPWAQRVAGARSSYGTLAMRGIEAGAAVVIIGFGALLLGGYIVNERMVGF